MALSKLLPDTPEMQSLREQAGHFGSSPITGIHLWFDREVTPLEHAVLLERTIQWMFQKSKILNTRRESGETGSYLELVVSSSKTLVDKSRNEIIDLAMRELAEFFPAVREAKLTKATVIKEVHATFSPTPGSDAYRPVAHQPVAEAVPGRRLDGDRLAFDHGRRGAQRIRRCRGAGGGERWRREVSRARSSGQRIDAAVRITPDPDCPFAWSSNQANSFICSSSCGGG